MAGRDGGEEGALGHQGDQVSLDVEDVRVDPQEGGQVQRRLEQRPAGVRSVAGHHPPEQFVDGERGPGRLHPLPEELEELVGEGGVGPHLLRLPEGVGDLALVLLQVDNLLSDDKLLRVSGEKVPELLDVLAGDVSDL